MDGRVLTSNQQPAASSSRLFPEADTPSLGSEQRHEERPDEDDRDQPAHRLRVGEALAENGFDGWNARRTKDAKLVRKAREEPAQVIGRQLVDMRRDDAPRSLDEELHQE